MIYKLIWDEATPIVQRRSEVTRQDIEHDIHVATFRDDESLLKTLMRITCCSKDIFDDDESTDEKLEYLCNVRGWPSSGSDSAIIIYLSRNGNEIYSSNYAGIRDNLDLERATEQEIKKAVLFNFGFDEKEIDEHQLPKELFLSDEDVEEFVDYPAHLADLNYAKEVVKRWLCRTYRHSLARGVEPEIDNSSARCDIYVGGIKWGKPLTKKDIDALDALKVR